MKEKTLLKISLLLVFLGLVLIYFYVDSFNFKAVESYQQLQPEEQVKLTGVVKRVTSTQNVTFLELAAQKEETVTVVLFNQEEVLLKEGDYVELVGTVEDYQGQREIIANEVVVKG